MKRVQVDQDFTQKATAHGTEAHIKVPFVKIIFAEKPVLV